MDKAKQAQEADLSVVNLEVMPLKNTLAANVLADELSQAILKIKALETLIDIAEQQFKIAIRKKSGAKQ